jgi:hypothetical protein
MALSVRNKARGRTASNDIARIALEARSFGVSAGTYVVNRPPIELDSRRSLYEGLVN